MFEKLQDHLTRFTEPGVLQNSFIAGQLVPLPAVAPPVFSPPRRGRGQGRGEKYVFITPHPALSHKGRGGDVVGELVAHPASPIKGEGQKTLMQPE